jgi:hypothetical protein
MQEMFLALEHIYNEDAMHSEEVNQIWRQSRSITSQPLSVMGDLSAVVSELSQIMSALRPAVSSICPEDPDPTPSQTTVMIDPRMLELRCKVALSKTQLMMSQLSSIATCSQSLTTMLYDYTVQWKETKDSSREALIQFAKLLGTATLPVEEHSSGCSSSSAGSN